MMIVALTGKSPECRRGLDGQAAADEKADKLQATETPQSVHPVSHLLAPAHNAVVDVEGHGAADRKAVLQPSWIAGNRRRPAALYT